MLDNEEGKVKPSEYHLAFNHQSFIKKTTVVCAGPLCNLLFAFFAYWVIFMLGINVITPQIGAIAPNSIADRASLKPQQIITTIDGRKTFDWGRVAISIFLKMGNKDKMKITTIDPNNKKSHIYLLDLKIGKLTHLILILFAA